MALTTVAVGVGGTGLTSVPHTVQVFTSGSGTYTLPTNCKAIKVTMVGGGGGGAGSGQGSTGGSGGAGGASTFGTTLLIANGGTGGIGLNAHGIPAGGTASLGAATGIALTGASGISVNQSISGYYAPGAYGGTSPFGGAGSSDINRAGGDASVNTGSGGGSGGSNSNSSATNSSGAAGGYVEALISAPTTTYSYAVGAKGTAGSAGTSSYIGGIGGSGVIIVEEYYV